MTSRVALMLASPTRVSKSQLLSLEKTLKYGLISVIEVGSLSFHAQKLVGVVLRVGSSFLLDSPPNTSPKPHLQKVLPWRNSYHIWDLGLGNCVKW